MGKGIEKGIEEVIKGVIGDPPPAGFPFLSSVSLMQTYGIKAGSGKGTKGK